VMAGLYHFTTRDAGGHKRYDREDSSRRSGRRGHRRACWGSQR
jgi:hypothetical protein